MLSIVNVIMDELLADDRTPRAFRAKFPEEVLQESLAGQLWFGAECLAAGSSIMNRELESSAMRPLAKAVTKSLDNVRNLLREQCLRIKTPNAPRLNLDTNDAYTETLCESLKIFDRLFAEFELLYVSAMVQVKSKQEHETQELICVLFSETLQRALRLRRLTQDQVDYFDPALMFSIPRLAIVAGLVTFPRGPLNMSNTENLSEMFRPFRTLLVKIRDLLRTLSAEELARLEQLLCTNGEIATTTATTATATTTIVSIEAAPTTATTTTATDVMSTSATATAALTTGRRPNHTTGNNNFSNCDDHHDDVEDYDDAISKHVITEAMPVGGGASRAGADDDDDSMAVPPINAALANADAEAPPDADATGRFDHTAWRPDDRLSYESPAAGSDCDSKGGDMEASMHSTDEPPSGFFLSNTNLGQLLQSIETPLTNNPFGEIEPNASDNAPDGPPPHDANGSAADAPTTPVSPMNAAGGFAGDSGIGTAESTSLDRTPDSEVVAAVGGDGGAAVPSHKCSANWERFKKYRQQQQQQQQRLGQSLSSQTSAAAIGADEPTASGSSQPATSHRHSQHSLSTSSSSSSSASSASSPPSSPLLSSSSSSSSASSSTSPAAAAPPATGDTSAHDHTAAATSLSAFLTRSSSVSAPASNASHSGGVTTRRKRSNAKSSSATAAAAVGSAAGSAGSAAIAAGDDGTSSSHSDSSMTRYNQKPLTVRTAGRMKFK